MTHLILLRCACRIIPNQQPVALAKKLTSTYAVWFGKPETGIPIPVEQIKAVIEFAARSLDNAPSIAL